MSPKAFSSFNSQTPQTRDLELPFSDGSVSTCWPHSSPYTRTFLATPVLARAKQVVRN